MATADQRESEDKVNRVIIHDISVIGENESRAVGLLGGWSFGTYTE